MALCVLLSLLLHAGLAWALDLLPRGRAGQQRRAVPVAARHVQVLRAAAAPKATKSQEPQQEVDAPFAKTSADERQRRPEQADFIGRHDALAGGTSAPAEQEADKALPSMEGRESAEEIVTFDQERQDGALEHEGKAETAPTAPVAGESLPPQPAQPIAKGKADARAENAEPEGESNEAAQPSAAVTAARVPLPDASGEGLKLDTQRVDDALTLAPLLPPPALPGLPEGSDGSSTSRPAHAAMQVYDPTLASSAGQPGLRTYERRTRSSGQFVFGKRPSLNVAATARGRYEAEIYRRIARVWYIACDEHRGDIIPGSITVSLRLNKSGRIDSMDLVRRRGASLSQQSFSFASIRRAALPPMPKEVQQDIIGSLYEMILTFNFD